MGTVRVSRRVNAASGTCPPFWNTVADEGCAPNTVLEAMVGVRA